MSTELVTIYGEDNVGTVEQPVHITRVSTRTGIGFAFHTKDGWVTISLAEIENRIALSGLASTQEEWLRGGVDLPTYKH
jgi:hypothetical protein